MPHMFRPILQIKAQLMLGTSSLTFVSDLWFPDFLMPSIGFPKCYVHQHSVRYVHFVFNFTTLVCATRPASALRTDVICSTHIAGNEILLHPAENKTP
jgi:hypothetical protein